MKKKAIICLLAALMTSLTACGGKSAPSTSAETTANTVSSQTASDTTETKEESIPSGETVTLELLVSDDTLEGGGMAKMVEKFNKEFEDKGIQVEMNEIAHADMDTQIQNRASVGELPALVRHTNFNDYIDYIHPLDGTALSQEDFQINTTRNGIFYSTPINATAVGMLINKTAFDEAGVSYPTTEEDRWTWDEFLAAISEVTAKTDCEYGMVIDYSSQRYSTILYTFGAEFFDPNDHTKVTLRSDETLEGLQFIMDLYTNGYCPVSVGIGSENAQSTFKTGKVAAHWAGNWVLTDYAENITDFEYAVVYAPYERECATSLGGNYLYAFEGTGQEEQAVTFLEWFYKPENYTEYCSYNNYLPSMLGIDPDYSVEGLDIFNAEMNASCEAPGVTSDVNAEHAGETYGEVVKETLAKAFVGELTAEEVLDTIIDTIIQNFSGVSE